MYPPFFPSFLLYVPVCVHHFSVEFSLVKSINMSLSVSELSSDNLRTCFQIVNAYVYLSATEFLQVRHPKTYYILLSHRETRKSEETKTSMHIYTIYSMTAISNHLYFQNYAESLCRSFCDLLKDITNEGQVQVLKVLSLSPPLTRTALLLLFYFPQDSFFILSY